MVSTPSGALDRFRSRIPDGVFHYALALVSLTAVTAAGVACFYFLGARHPVWYGLIVLYIIVILGSAWLGYGQGLLILVLAIFAVPRMVGSNRTLAQDAVRFGLMAVICLLISHISQRTRRREGDLRFRVRERTAEAERSAEATREALTSLQEQAQLLDFAHDAILSLDRDHTIRFWNQGAERMYGWSREEAIGRISDQLFQTEFPEGKHQVHAKLLANERWEGDLMHTRRDGTRMRVASRWAMRRDAQGQLCGFLEIANDITEKRRIEGQLQHTQKLESLGILAGGVAHDFNNLLTGILGNSSLALEGMPDNHPDRRLIEEVVTAAQRAADLTRQLLAYAGKGRFVMRTVDLSSLVREISGLVQTSIPKHVELRMQLSDGLRGVDADPGQLQQIVMNLVINGAEAIGPGGGSVLVKTTLQPVDPDYIATMSSQGELLKPGDYVCLEVHDTGEGMAEETVARIFDPFFTTKFAGRGLGLSAVLGIVRAHQGALKVYSSPGRGTTFKVLFPTSSQPVDGLPRAVAGSLQGLGTVLIVDDEKVVRETARRSLERYGYSTLTAEDGAQAVEQYRRLRDAVSLVLLDLTMPVMNGEQALNEMQSINPQVRVLLSSGFNEVEAVQRFSNKGLAGFIQKPYTAAALAEKVKEVLAG